MFCKVVIMDIVMCRSHLTRYNWKNYMKLLVNKNIMTVIDLL